MPRYVQYRQTDGSYKLIEVVRAAPRPRVHLHTARPSFVSPIDGEVIEGRRQLREHKNRHGVVHLGEYGPDDGKEYFAKKEKERDGYYTGESPQLRKEVKEDVVEAVHKLQQGYKPKPEKENAPS